MRQEFMNRSTDDGTGTNRVHSLDSEQLPYVFTPISRRQHHCKLTARQLAVLAKLVEGKPNKIIARELQISSETVKVHVATLLKLLAVSNRTQAAMVALMLEMVGQTAGSAARTL